MHTKRQGRAWYHWFAEDDSAEERKLISKLDLLIVPYAFIAYWIKYIDQANLSEFRRFCYHILLYWFSSFPSSLADVHWLDNAYVAGLAEDLGFYGNELVNLQTMYTVGAVVGQIPFAFLFPIFKMNYLIPALELGWGLFTLLQYRTQSYAELMAYRFLVGLFEVSIKI
jgi:hypothetical protein